MDYKCYMNKRKKVGKFGIPESLRYLLLIAIISSLFSCKKPGDASIVSNIETTNNNQIISVSSIKLRVQSSSFESTRKNEDESFNLQTPNSVFEIINPYTLNEIKLKEGNHSKVKVKLNFSKSNPENGIEVIGTYNNTPVQILIFENININTSASSFEINADDQKTLKIKLNLTKLFSGISTTELNNAVISSGILVIAMDPNLNIYSKLRSNLNSAFEVSIE